MSLISVNNLTKQFQRPIRQEGFTGAVKDLFHRQYEYKTAVNDISFQINQGEIVGYLGPNGAGKSTTIKMMVGILVPTAGSVTVNELIPYKNRKIHAKNIGVVFGQRTQLWWDIPVTESLLLMKYMYKIPNDQYRKNIELFSDILDLHEFKNTAVRQLSLGQRMRADLCAALLHDPKILFLDEPTIGLDVVVKEKIREFIKEINKVRQTTVVLTTHDMDDVEKLCSRVIVIDHGQIMYDGNISHLKDKYGSDEIITIEPEHNHDLISLRDKLLSLNVMDTKIKDLKLQITYNKGDINSMQILSKIMSESSIIDFTIQPCEIDEVIRRMYTENSLKGKLKI
ncbi:ATP-binding cassette domain-containing protein [Paenibacillus pinisoli]|uniref:ATP-binding cassette domain-containing protein n=1 Tax=Paenibacillus pinisoli TaxID=1276110 RepID=A0A3A6PM67_9BACL|nr:ATP-binding cassette domain-containing protein [Paenibacillus pinisoli]RJX37531.1 ATP-binding cassette domain-containing protein [Paenibacillus pinisoli]